MRVNGPDAEEQERRRRLRERVAYAENYDRYVLREIDAERERQIVSEGWTPEHDDGHDRGEMARAAGCYALYAGQRGQAQVAAGYAPGNWPWDAAWWKPKDRRRDLIRAAALIVAEVERLDRASRANADLQALIDRGELPF